MTYGNCPVSRLFSPLCVEASQPSYVNLEFHNLAVKMAFFYEVLTLEFFVFDFELNKLLNGFLHSVCVPASVLGPDLAFYCRRSVLLRRETPDLIVIHFLFCL